MLSIGTAFPKNGRITKKPIEMSSRGDIQELYRQMEERRRVRAKRPIAEKLKIAEELRDLQKALAPLREANKARVRSAQRRDSD